MADYCSYICSCSYSYPNEVTFIVVSILGSVRQNNDIIYKSPVLTRRTGLIRGK